MVFIQLCGSLLSLPPRLRLPRVRSFIAMGGFFLALAAFARADAPQGVLSLSNSGKPANSAVLANPDVTGISVRYAWKDLEPAEKAFNWVFLDSEVARAAAAGKQVCLRIGTQSEKPAWVTAAIQQAGGKFFTFLNGGITTTIPVFWDPTYLAKKKAMIAALGAHFTNNPAVTLVIASFANASSEDWSVPHTGPDIANWFAVGYSTANMLAAGQQILDTTLAAFPNQAVAIAVGGNGHTGGTGNLDPTATYVAETAVAAARVSGPGRVFPQINSLSTFNPVAPSAINTAWNLIWNSQPDVGAQMVYRCANDPGYRVNGGVPMDPATALTLSVNKGVTYGVRYIEIYQTDVVGLPATITYARIALGAGTSAPTTTIPLPSKRR